MTERLWRLGAVIRADLLIRFRRPSTVVVFLLLSAFAYMWIPDPATGRTLLVIDNQRAVYNSAAIGMATAVLGAIFIGLAGFYVVSNAIRRDVVSRCGSVIASTQMHAGEYLIGKITGNIVFLSTFMLGFMTTSMVMVVVRGEAPLEPLLFAKQYLILVPAAIVFVSVIAIVFESVPFLSGKFGDVLYFFLWSGSLGAVVSNVKTNDPGVAGYFDISGFGFLKSAMQTDRLSIGSTTFDASKGLHVFNGLEVSAAWIAPRIVSTFGPLLLVVVALLFFHRFDPARLRKAIQKGSRSWLSRIGMLAKPLARVAYSMVPRGSGGGILSAARADVLMALTAFPASVLVIVIFSIAGMAGALVEVFPIAFAAAAVLIADVASREKRSGMTGLVYSAPLLKQRFVGWKFLSALLLTTLVVAVPVLRAALTRPASVLPLVVGIAFVAATATALGVISANPKTFIVVFLTFWYVMVSDHGRSAGLDFAGFYGKATPMITAAYAMSAVAALVVAHAFHTAQLRRSW